MLLPRVWLTESAARIASTLLGAEFDTNALREPHADEDVEHFSSEPPRSYCHLVTSDEQAEDASLDDVLQELREDRLDDQGRLRYPVEGQTDRLRKEDD